MAKRKMYPGNLEKRGNAYRWRACVGGQRFRETFHVTSGKEAEKLVRERHRELEKRIGKARTRVARFRHNVRAPRSVRD
jgi:hypothetical protein